MATADVSQTDEQRAEDALITLEQEAEIRGAVGVMPTMAESTRHRNSPVSNDRVRDLIQRRNTARDGAVNDLDWSPRGEGARARRRMETDLVGRGSFISRVEGRLVTSPRRAFNLNDDHGRYLNDRLARVEQAEVNRERAQQDELRDMERRHRDERDRWRRRQEESDRQIQQLQQQFAAMQAVQQQQQVQPQMQAPVPMQMQAPVQQLVTPPQVQPVVAPVLAQPQLQQQQQVDMWGAQAFGQPMFNPQQPPPGWQVHQLPPPVQRMATPAGGRTPGRMNQTDEEIWDRQSRQGQPRYMDRRDLKLRIFKGKDVESWKSLYEDFAEQFDWTPAEKKLQLKAHVEDWIRSMFTGMPADTTAEEMMTRLVSRFGVNMTATEVENKLLTIERKSGEDLYTLADRVRNLANRAHMTQVKRRMVMRQAFFTALRGNSELQHWVNRYDNPDDPDMNLTLDLAIEWEHQHGTSFKSAKVHHTRDSEINSPDVTSTAVSDGESSEVESVNKIDYIPLKSMTSEEAKILAKHNNEVVSLMKKQAYTVLDDRDSRGGRSQNSRSGYTSNSSRSSGYTRPRRSRSRGRSGRDDRRRRSRDRGGRDYKKEGRGRDYDKKKKDDWRGKDKKGYRDRDKDKDRRGRRDKKDRVEEVRDSSGRNSSRSRSRDSSRGRSNSRQRSSSENQSE